MRRRRVRDGAGVTWGAHGGLIVALALAALTGCAGDSPTRAQGGPAAAVSIPSKPTLDEKGHPVGLHEWNPFTDRITSGGQPDGEEGFKNLAAMGYTTIVSVDGARPDLELARKYGIRYVHVPMQYSGVREEEAAQVASAIEASEGPVYVHCHHGKHRSPAATGAACVKLGLMTPEAAEAKMKISGTDPKYKGLYRDVAAARPYSPAERAALPKELQEFVNPGDLATWMVDVDLRFDHLKASKEAQWGVPPASPDVDPPHEARMLWEHFREIARLAEAKERGDTFLKLLAEGEVAATELESALRARDAKASDAAHDRVRKNCAACHAKYRDN